MAATTAITKSFRIEEAGDTLLRLLSDEYVRKIIRATIASAKSIEELSHDEIIPISTCYRRVHELIRLGLIRVESTIITPRGKKFMTFRSTIKDVTVTLSSERFSVEAKSMPSERPRELIPSNSTLAQRGQDRTGHSIF